MKKSILEWLEWEMNLRIQIILTWTVLSLTCFVGLVEILPIIKIYETMYLTDLLVLVSIFLLVAGDYCVLRIFFHLGAWKTIEQKLSPNLRKRLVKGRSLPLKIFLSEDKDKKFPGLRNTLVYLSLTVWSAIWIAIILLKAFA